MEELEISPGVRLPMVGFGTWQLQGKECVKAVKEAYELGYRHFDTALFYDNHKEIAKGLAGCSDLLFTSKFMPFHLDQMSVRQACEKTLKELKIHVLDLFLMHYPDRSRPMVQILIELAELVELGLVRAVGVSNFTIHHLELVKEAAAPICVNQVEYHPYLNQKELLAYCLQKGIHLIAFRSLGKGALHEDPLLKEMGRKYGKSAAQICLRFLVQKNIPVIPKSVSVKHMKENLEVCDFRLEEEDFRRLDSLEPKPRFCLNELCDFDYECV